MTDFAETASVVMGLLADISRGTRPKVGAMECPICKTGKLAWRMSGPRAFVCACSTKGCVQAIG